jgi:RNA polymerase sigma factor (sigma-70 family)
VTPKILLSQNRWSGVDAGVGGNPPGPDAAQVAGLRVGDEAAFAAVYARFRRPLFGFLRRAVGRTDVAEDLFQETWMALARAAPRLRPDTDLAGWLFTVARNEFRSHLRWTRLDVSRWISLAEDTSPASAPGPETQTAQARLVTAVERALPRLPAAHRDVLLLVTVEELDQEHVARILGISYAALRQRLARARAALAALVGIDDLDVAKELHGQAVG